jgi:hypothetical protein
VYCSYIKRVSLGRPATNGKRTSHNKVRSVSPLIEIILNIQYAIRDPCPPLYLA